MTTPESTPDVESTEGFSVNVINENNQVEWTRQFKTQIAAEAYIDSTEFLTHYSVTEYNFTRKFSKEDITKWRAEEFAKLEEAKSKEKECRERTKNNLDNPKEFPCEVCGKPHWNYECCERCNYSTHTCHFCGDDLGHAEVSACYILEDE